MSADAVREQVALVTGAGRGLGRAIAESLAARGVIVVAADRDLGLLSWIKGAPSADRYRSAHVDVGDSQSVGQLIEQIEVDWGVLDIVVNNAGVLTVTPSNALDDEIWEPIIQVNLGGTIRVCQASHHLLLRSELASIVNISSITASVGLPGRLAYAASKAAIESLSRTLAVEWGPLGIRVNAIAPGFFATERAEAVHQDGDADPAARSALTPQRRPGHPVEIGEATAWLALEASFVNGQVITVDGGFSISAETAVRSAGLTAPRIHGVPEDVAELSLNLYSNG